MTSFSEGDLHKKSQTWVLQFKFQGRGMVVELTKKSKVKQLSKFNLQELIILNFTVQF